MVERWWRWQEKQVQTLDVLTALALGLLFAFVSPHDLAPFAFTLALVAPLAGRHRFPVASTVAVLLIAFSQWLLTIALGHEDLLLLTADLSVLIALYSITIYGPMWAVRAAAGGALLGALLESSLWFLLIRRGPEATVIAFALCLLAVISSLAIGGLSRARLDRLSALEERARLLELEQTQRTELALVQERNRIARDLHDIVAHSLAVIITQADGGRYAAEADPRAAVGALTVVSSTGRSAMADMRRLLGLLREDGPALSAAPTMPQPGPADLQALVDSVSVSGVSATLTMNDAPNPVSEGLGLTVYRIVQEALTNILRHAGPDVTAQITITWQAQAVEVSVVDDGRGAAAPMSGHLSDRRFDQPGVRPATDRRGHGLIGMRERAEVFGGTVTAGPRSGGGFAVHATMTYDPTVQGK